MGYQILPAITNAGGGASAYINVVADSAGTLYGLNTATGAGTQLLSAALGASVWTGAALLPITSPAPTVLLCMDASDRLYAIEVTIPTVVGHSRVFYYTGAAWVDTLFNAAGFGVGTLSSAVTLGTTLYVFGWTPDGTQGRVLKYDGAAWAAVTPFADITGPDGPFGGLFTFGGALYLLGNTGSVLAVSGSGWSPIVAGIWDNGSQVYPNVNQKMAIAGGRLYIPELEPRDDLHAAALWSWDGVAATWTVEAPYDAAIQSNSPTAGAIGGDIYVALYSNGRLYTLTAGVLTLVATAPTRHWYQLLSLAGTLFLYDGVDPSFNVGKLTFVAGGLGILPSFVPGF